MYCPNCGQQQISEEMRFCSRCGLALTGLSEWLASGRLPLQRADELQPPTALSPRRKGIRRAGKLMFLSGVLFPIFLVFSAAAGEGAPMAIPFLLFFVSLAMMLYARIFSDNTPPLTNQPGRIATVGSARAHGSLPPANTTAIPPTGRPQVRTNELAQPPSVTEHTTRFLDNE